MGTPLGSKSTWTLWGTRGHLFGIEMPRCKGYASSGVSSAASPASPRKRCSWFLLFGALPVGVRVTLGIQIAQCR